MLGFFFFTSTMDWRKFAGGVDDNDKFPFSSLTIHGMSIASGLSMASFLEGADAPNEMSNPGDDEERIRHRVLRGLLLRLEK